MTIVLTLAGLDTGQESDKMQRWLPDVGGARLPVDYPRQATPEAIAEGSSSLSIAITTALRSLDNVVVIGHSLGAQVVGEWLRTHGMTGPSPDRLRFYLTGNPTRRYGMNPSSRGSDGRLLVPTPDTTRYDVYDISRRWDGWSNHDNWPESRRTFWSSIRLFWGQAFVHADYTRVRVQDCTVRCSIGHTVYLMAD